MKSKYLKPSNIIFFVVLALMLIPQTRKPIQVWIHKGLSVISTPSEIDSDKQEQLSSYNWSLLDEHGNTFNFYDHKGKVVLLNFWATWCPPCIAEMPSMQALYNDYKDKVAFVFVTSDWFKDVTPFMEKNNYTFNVYRPAANQYPEQFDVRTIPRTFLIAKDGAIVMDKAGAANWNSDNIRALLDKLLLD